MYIKNSNIVAHIVSSMDSKVSRQYIGDTLITSLMYKTIVYDCYSTCKDMYVTIVT